MDTAEIPFLTMEIKSAAQKVAKEGNGSRLELFLVSVFPQKVFKQKC